MNKKKKSKKKLSDNFIQRLSDSAELLQKMARESKVKLCCLVHTHELFEGRPYCRSCTRKLIHRWLNATFKGFK
jgi:hypothetical protein